MSQQHQTTGNGNKKICIGIPSVQRQDSQYMRDAVGSLLDGLTLEERKEIFFMVFIPHSEPAIHPDYNETWLHGLTDRVLTYNFDDDNLKRIQAMEANGGSFLEKGLLDYSYLLSRCAEQHTPYIAIFEDDTIAMHGWYRRTVAAIRDAEEHSALQHAKPTFLYLRLFYTEEFLGWNSEYWRTYVFYSVCLAFLLGIILFLSRDTQPAVSISVVLGTRRALLTAYVFLSALIVLYFALGRITVLPPPNGVHEMPQFGCCSQAFVFPRDKALELVSFFNERQTGFMDTLTEEFANARGELRYAITPSVVQHVGTKSSKTNSNGPISKQKVWSFAFERYDERQLRKEHEAALALRAGQE